MKVVTASEMQNIDSKTIESTGIPGEVLMGFAGKSIADYIISDLRSDKKIAVFSGTGNNGGDGFIIAYLLHNNGCNVDVFLAGDIAKLSKTSVIYYNICRNSNIKIVSLKEQHPDEIILENYDLIIDAMLGTGFEGTPRGIIKDSIIHINNSSVKILSVDLPSGLSSDGRSPEGEVINADITVTIGLHKISLVTYPGIKFAGKVIVKEIGFPVSLTESPDLSVDLIDCSYVGTHINIKNNTDSHKGTNGHVLFVGGFDNMEGAVLMSAMAAFETGVGLATLLTTHKAREIVAGIIPELITRSVDPDEVDIESFFKEERQYNALVIGPGIGRSGTSGLIFNTIIDKLNKYGITKALIDGDGLFHLSEYLKTRKLPAGVSFIITPHFGEASRLSARKISEIKNNRFATAKELAQRISATTLLKGPATIVSDGKNSLINTTGNMALSTAGSGDVLSGIIGALMLRNDALISAGIGAYIHGLAADLSVKENSNPGVLKATDLIRYIRPAFKHVFDSVL